MRSAGLLLAVTLGLAPAAAHAADVTINGRVLDPGELFADSSTVPENPLPRQREILGFPSFVVEGRFGIFQISRCSSCPGPARLIIDDGLITGVHRLVFTDARIRLTPRAPAAAPPELEMEFRNVFPGLVDGLYPHGVVMDGVFACRGGFRCVSPVDNRIEVSGLAGDVTDSPLELIKAVGDTEPSLEFGVSPGTRRFARQATEAVLCQNGSACDPVGALKVRIRLTEPGDALILPGSIALLGAHAEGAPGETKLAEAIAALLAPPPGLPCGGAVPCACGGILVASRVLGRDDPVVQGECLGDGLTIAASDVDLNLHCATIRGEGSGTGIVIAPGVTGVTIHGGRVLRFATGIGAADTLGSTITFMRVHGNSDAGVDLTGHGNRIERVVAEANGTGIAVDGDGNVVTLNRASGNDTALTVLGDLNTIARNVVRYSTGPAMLVDGTSAMVEENHVGKNGGDGLTITGTGHAVTANVFRLNAGHGLSVPVGSGMSFDGNRTGENAGFGILDATAGAGTGGTANTYLENVCRDDVLGGSSPAGLCS